MRRVVEPARATRWAGCSADVEVPRRRQFLPQELLAGGGAGKQMTLIGYQSRNHPQQVAKLGVDDTVDDRGTLPEVFDPLHREFRFTLDAAASARNAKCARFFTREQDGLSLSWRGESVWCNPPYSDIEPWIAKAVRETLAGGCHRVVFLLPNNRTEQGWWQKYVEPYRDKGLGVSTRFLRGRPRFIRPPEAQVPKKGDRPPFGLVVVIFENELGDLL